MARKISVRGRVLVSKEVIEVSRRANSRSCMVAEALRVKFPSATNVAVDVQSMRLSIPQDGLRYIWLTPRSVQNEIVRFDLGVQPKEFSFNLPQEAQTIPMRRRPPRTTRAIDGGPKPKPKATMAAIPNTRSKPRIQGGSPPPVLSFRREFGLMALNVQDLLEGN